MQARRSSQLAKEASATIPEATAALARGEQTPGTNDKGSREALTLQSCLSLLSSAPHVAGPAAEVRVLQLSD